MIKHLSYSSIDRLTRCAKSWEFQYVDQIKTPINGNLLRGDAYHKAIAHAYTNLVVYRDKPPIDEVLQVYSDTWDKRLLDRIVIDEGEEISVPSVDFKDKDPGKMKDEGATLLGIYYSTILPKVIPQEVEVWKDCIYEDVPLLAKMDLIDFGDIVIDHKLKAKMFSEVELAKDFQSTIYGLILGRDDFELHYHAAIAVKEPHIEIIPVKRNKDDMDWVGGMIVSAWKQIWSGIFPPSTQGWWCAPDQCAFWSYCHIPKSF